MQKLSNRLIKIIFSLMLASGATSLSADTEAMLEMLKVVNSDTVNVGFVDSSCLAECSEITQKESATSMQIFEQVKARVSCDSERVDLHMHSSREGDYLNSFSIVKSVLSNEPVEEYYAGQSVFGDIIVASKTASSDVYTVSISYCKDNFDILNSERVIDDFKAPNGIYLTEIDNWGVNGIIALETGIHLEAYNYSEAVWFSPTTFYPLR